MKTITTNVYEEGDTVKFIGSKLYEENNPEWYQEHIGKIGKVIDVRPNLGRGTYFKVKFPNDDTRRYFTSEELEIVHEH